MITLLVLIASIVAIFVILNKSRFDTFKARKIPYHPFAWKDFVSFQKEHFKFYLQRVYDLSKEKGPVSGYFMGFTPMFMVNEIEMWQRITIKDFNYFTDRGLYHNKKVDPLSESLLTMEGERWREMRHKLTPSFSSGKIKAMFPIVLAISDNLNEILYETATQSDNWDWNTRNVLQRFTSDVIGQCGFGLDCNGLRDPDTHFIKYGVRAFKGCPDASTLKGLFKMEFKTLCRFLGVRRYPKVSGEFYTNVVEHTISYREENNVSKEDIMNTLIKLKNSDGPDKMTVKEIIAQCYIFLAAGYETTSSSMNYLFYNLAKYPELQEKVREDIFSVLKKHKNEFTYEAIMDMNILDKFICESLRRYPTSTVLIRQATKDYKVPDSHIVIRKGEWLTIPIQSVQMDPEFYPNPDEFNIERDFKDLLNFGMGPRTCIAERFAVTEIKIAIVNFLRTYRVIRTENTPRFIQHDKDNRLLTTGQTLFLKIEKL